MATLIEIQNKAKNILRDAAERLSEDEIFDIALEALNQFSRDYPSERVADIAGDGGYAYDLPSDWVSGFSQVPKVEYPQGNRPPTYLESADFRIYKNTSTEQLYFDSHTPGASETIRITYTTLWLEGTVSSIPPNMVDALAILTAANCCNTLARVYAQSVDASLEADVIDHQGKSDVYAQRSRDLMKRYNAFVGKTGSGPKAASGQADWDVNYPWGGDRLTHPRKQR